jgi:hypothetical protein
MSVERDEAAEVVTGAEPPARWRIGKTTLLAAGAIAVGAVLLAAYWVVQHGDLLGASSTPNAAQTPVAAAPRELTNEAAAQLLADALARHPVVARLALGDVATVDKNGQALPFYPQLAQAQIVRLRFCHFPGTDAAANQICLADLTDKAKPYVYSGDTPFKAIIAGADALQPKNRSFAQLILAVPRVSRVTQVTDSRRGEKQIAYAAAFELTPLASTFGVSAESLPSALTGTAVARSGPGGWAIENDGLQQNEAKAN